MAEGTDEEHREGEAALRVLRLCSVFEPPRAWVEGAAAAAFDPIGGMQNHAAALTRALDRRGLRQTVVTSRLAAPAGQERLGERARVVQVGVPTRRFRQAWSLGAAPPPLPAPDEGVRADLVHAHQGEDLAVLPLVLAAARRHRCPLVVTVHCAAPTG